MKSIYRFLAIHHLLIGLGAIFGGMVAILDPWEPLGIPVELLEGSPFENYLIPGLILFAFVGLGNLFCAYTALRSSVFQGYTSSVFSWGLVIWIVVQCAIIGSVEVLHVLYFVLGLVGAALAAFILYRRGSFPFGSFRGKK